MSLSDFWQGVISYTEQSSAWEISGWIFGILCVVFLIRESIWTWPFGIAYVITAFVVFWNARLYGDFILHIFFFILNVYGWYFWIYGKNKNESEIPVTKLNLRGLGRSALFSAVGIFLFAVFLINLPNWISGIEPASLPFWDSTTSVLSVTAMFLTARKKIDNWYYWFVVDVLATGIYFYKELYFFSLLYLVYVGMAIAGYLAWRKSMLKTSHA